MFLKYENMNALDTVPKSVFYGLLAIGMAVLAGDFLFVYLPLSGWILQSILVGVYLEYIGIKKTVIMVAIMETFFMASYGGSIAIAAITSLVRSEFILPIIIGLYCGLLMAVLFLGLITNYIFHKIRLFERINQRPTKS
jgi:hypothetical protein